MKKFVLAGVAIAGLLAVPAIAFQQGRIGPGSKPMARTDVPALVQEHFAKADANHDGFITKDEMMAQMGQAREERHEMMGDGGDMFAKIDTNKDGSISRAEFDAHHKGMREHREGARGPMGHGPGGRMGMGAAIGAGMFANADTDKDGRVSLSEATAAHLAMFDRADADHNGTVTPDERRSAWQAFRAQHTQPPAD